tara:strand:- start:2062 stop:3099 length:1038 start_codon:yes stop_codon:yes gene_type:complete
MDKTDDITLKEILRVFSEYKSEILSRKKLIFITVLIFCVFALLLSKVIESKYQADITFVVQSPTSKSSSLSNIGNIASSFGFNIGSSESAFSQANVMELFKSRRIIEATILKSADVNDKKNILLIDYYANVKNLRNSSGWINDKIDKIDFNIKSNKRDSLITLFWNDIVENNLKVSFNSNDASIITLSFIFQDQYFAKVFVENIIEEMGKFYIGYNTSQSRNTLEFIQNRADSVYLELKLAEEEYAKIKDINQRIVKASGRLKELQLMRTVQVLNTMYLELIKNLELSKLTLLKETPIIEVMDGPVLPLKDKKIKPLVLYAIFVFLAILFSSIYIVFRKIVVDSK